MNVLELPRSYMPEDFLRLPDQKRFEHTISGEELVPGFAG